MYQVKQDSATAPGTEIEHIKSRLDTAISVADNINAHLSGLANRLTGEPAPMPANQSAPALVHSVGGEIGNIRTLLGRLDETHEALSRTASRLGVL